MLDAAVEKMRAEGVADAAIDTFRHYYEQLSEGETGDLPEASLEPVTDLPDAEALPAAPDAPLDSVVVVKLNGGLGTSMGMTRAKSLIEAKDGLSFLDLVVKQVLSVREATGARVPLVLMNSFATREDSLAALRAHAGVEADVPLDFLQNKEPKLLVDELAPVSWDADPSLEWCPPGHGDLYPALLGSGMLGALLEAGYRYAFVSNSDNLGAVLDERILAWFAESGAPVAMEAADRTEADKKGGHIALRDGQLVLRETAQTPEEDLDAFQDVSRHRYFNTNNLWLDLSQVQRALDERGGVLGLPMIVNRKTVDPADKGSPAVIQIETAMGAAIGVFEGAQAIRVPRSRFAPVKTTSDLLVVRSDAYRLTEEGFVRAVREADPLVSLDDEHYKLLADFEARFPAGPVSLRECSRLEVQGDVRFGAGVVCRGDVQVSGPREVPDGTVLE